MPSKQIAEAKAKVRTDIAASEWDKYAFYRVNFAQFSDNCQRVSGKHYSPELHCSNIPCVFTDVIDDWPTEKWGLEYLLKHHKHEKFKVGQDDDGKAVFLSFKHYYKYLHSSEAETDDSPLYIFDGGFATRSAVQTGREKKKASSCSIAACHIAENYSVPPMFRDDLFRFTGSRRPPFRWIVIGPKRSGTGIHIDPLGTSAWNALISGRKRWVIFPPFTPKSLYKPKGIGSEGVVWFAHAYPAIKASGVQMIEIDQRPGETVFVPGGWPHVVLNLETSVAVTHNFCSPEKLDEVYLKTRYNRPKLAAKLERILLEGGPKDITKSKKRKKYRKLGKGLKKLKFIPRLEDSTDSSSSSSSSSEDDVVCECHGTKFN